MTHESDRQEPELPSAAGFVEIDGKRFALSSAALELYHCDSGEADWNLKLGHAERESWLSGTVAPSPTAAADLAGRELVIDNRDLDELFGHLLGRQITTYPGGQAVCRACFTVSTVPAGLQLSSAFEFDWDRYLDPPDASYPAPRTARLELIATLEAIHPGDLPE